MAEQVKRVYAFGKDADGKNVTEGNKDMKMVLGGEGANLAEMANIGLPVPPGFTITCQTCMEYANADNTWPEGALDTIEEYRTALDKGIVQGRKEGREEGRGEAFVETARALKAEGIDVSVIVKCTGLSTAEIQGL